MDDNIPSLDDVRKSLVFNMDEAETLSKIGMAVCLLLFLQFQSRFISGCLVTLLSSISICIVLILCSFQCKRSVVV